MVLKWAQELAGFASCNFADGAADGDGGAGSDGGSGGDGSGSGGGAATVDAGGGGSAERVPWAQDKRFREDYAALQDFKKERDEYNRWKGGREQFDRIRQEYEAFTQGKHPKVQEHYNGGFVDAQQQYEALIDEMGIRGLVEAHVKGRKAGEPGKAEEKPETKPEDKPPAGASLDEVKAWYAEERAKERREETLGSLFDKCADGSPLGQHPQVRETLKTIVRDLMGQARAKMGEQVTSAQLDEFVRKLPEFYKQAEAVFAAGHEHLTKADRERIAQQRRNPTLPSVQMKPGMTPYERSEAERKAYMASLGQD